jgi:hypothetical protein
MAHELPIEARGTLREAQRGPFTRQRHSLTVARQARDPKSGRVRFRVGFLSRVHEMYLSGFQVM